MPLQKIVATPSKDLGALEARSDRTRNPIQAKMRTLGAEGFAAQDAALAPERQVQARAADGTRGQGGSLPHVQRLQAAFGAHDISGVRAHTDGNAKDACNSIGASAYASGNDVAFGSQPDLHTAAHEAAHIVQQRQGVSLPSGVGREGDAYERQADAVADAVVQGKSAEGLLGGAARSESAEHEHVQLYGGKATTDYSLNADPESESAPFMNEAMHPSMKIGENGEIEAGFDLQEAEHPLMRFSDDGTMAIQATSRVTPGSKGNKEMVNAKELYATDEVITRSNKLLEASGSKVVLESIGHSIDYKGKNLVGVRPQLRSPSSQVGSGLLDLQTSICRDVAEIVTTGPDSTHRGEFVIKGEGKRDAEYQKSTDVQDARDLAKEQLGGGVTDSNLGQKFGKHSRSDKGKKALNDKGLNEGASPEVGQAYGIFSIADLDKKGVPSKKDYSSGVFAKSRTDVWGYHFGGVVAKSTDGRDNATLENFNRNADINRAVIELGERLAQEYKVEAVQALKDIQGLGGKELIASYLLARLRKAKNVDSEASKIQKQINECGGSAWYFALYGSNKGQSFHEQHSKGGSVVNPMTVAVDMNKPGKTTAPPQSPKKGTKKSGTKTSAKSSKSSKSNGKELVDS